MRTIIVVTAYGEDNYFQKRYEDIVGFYSRVDKAIVGAMNDGMTEYQREQLKENRDLILLDNAIQTHQNVAVQVTFDTYEDEDCKSSYMFQTFNLDEDLR